MWIDVKMAALSSWRMIADFFDPFSESQFLFRSISSRRMFLAGCPLRGEKKFNLILKSAKILKGKKTQYKMSNGRRTARLPGNRFNFILNLTPHLKTERKKYNFRHLLLFPFHFGWVLGFLFVSPFRGVGRHGLTRSPIYCKERWDRRKLKVIQLWRQELSPTTSGANSIASRLTDKKNSRVNKFRKWRLCFRSDELLPASNIHKAFFTEMTTPVFAFRSFRMTFLSIRCRVQLWHPF